MSSSDNRETVPHNPSRRRRQSKDEPPYYKAKSEAGAEADDPFAQTGASANKPENKPGERLPKAVAYAEAGVGDTPAEFSVFEAKTKGLNTSAGAGVSVIRVGAMARAEIGSASAKSGPISVKVGLGVDTGASVGLTGIEAKEEIVQKTGDPETVQTPSVLGFLGSQVSCSVM